MVSRRRNRKRRPARAAPTLSPRRRLLVVCEGSVTEPAYIRGFTRWRRNPLIDVKIPPEHGVPLTLVKLANQLNQDAAVEARQQKDENLLYDEVWCVFDVDEHAHLNEARQLAAARGVQLAVSNPCFELWLLLHFRDSPGAQHRRAVQGMVGKYLAGYGKRLNFEDVKHGYLDAQRRAEQIQKLADEDGESHRNPSTGVHRLTESIAATD